MIKQIVQGVAESSPCKFSLLKSSSENLEFYQASDLSYQRFFVVLETDELISPSELNDKVQSNTPEILLEKPSFAKNTDLVILFRLDSLAELNKHEYSIFDIEENAYSLKKHVLYYTNSELEQLNQHLSLGESIGDLITTPDLFNQYKDKPNKETAFSLACRLYIKLPFLAVPASKLTLISANKLADTFLNNEKLLDFSNLLEQQLNDGREYQEIMEALIDEHLEN